MAEGILAGNTTGNFILALTITPASVGATTTAEQTFSCPGARVGDYVDACGPGVTAGVTLTNKRVSANDTIALTFANVTAGSLTPPAGVHVIQISRASGGLGKQLVGG